jgi:hypothetical protein
MRYTRRLAHLRTKDQAYLLCLSDDGWSLACEYMSGRRVSQYVALFFKFYLFWFFIQYFILLSYFSLSFCFCFFGFIDFHEAETMHYSSTGSLLNLRFKLWRGTTGQFETSSALAAFQAS